jgi:molybdenum cofactor cytidylyltransferase
LFRIDEADLATALQLAADADLILILTASATSDPGDVAPAALRRAGGMVERFGMPVDPGNLLFLGQLGRTPVIGLPGCARSPALNGADWVMERVICGVPIGGADIAAMGVGGLLKEIPQRGRLREAK